MKKKIIFFFWRLIFYQWPHHNPPSQLIWIESQPASFHIWDKSVGKYKWFFKSNQSSVCLIFQIMIYLHVSWGILCLLKVFEWFFVWKGNSYTIAEFNVLENRKSSHWQQKHPGVVFLYLKLSMMNFSPEGFFS